ncbi:MAG: FG-GAP repeat domain-containing protein [Planctomycetota bacterium]
MNALAARWPSFTGCNHQREGEAPAEPHSARPLPSAKHCMTARSRSADILPFRRPRCRITTKLTLIVLSVLCGCGQQSSVQKNNDNATGEPARSEISINTGSASETSAPQPPSAIRFRTLGPESGFSFTRFDDQRGQWRILEANGGGVAVLDIDLDCWPDVFLTNGCRIPINPADRSTPGQLFRNRTRLKFDNVSRPSGLEQFGLGYGCAVADADEDGFDDLYLTRYGGNQFWQNNGDGTFTEVAAANGTRCGDWGSSAAFADLNRDGWQDLYVVNYLAESDTSPRLCPENASPTGFIGCSPALFDGVADRLYLSDGSGGYVDASADSGLASHPGKGLGVVICDFDGDSLPEIYVANDGEANFLFTVAVQPTAAGNVPGIRLTDIALQANAALNELGYAQASMGIAVGDFDHNSRSDLFLTHFFGDTNTLYLNHSTPGQLGFRDATRAAALGPPSRQKLGFGTVAADFDGDGWEDIFVANGHVDDRSWMQGGQPFQMQPQLFQNQQGRFADVSVSTGDWFQQAWLGRGAATADFNQDGRPDLVASCQLGPAAILINETRSLAVEQDFGFLSLTAIGTSGPRTPWGLTLQDPAVGALWEVHPGESFQSASGREFMRGLKSGKTELQVRFPGGQPTPLQTPGGHYFLLENRGLFVRKY